MVNTSNKSINFYMIGNETKVLLSKSIAISYYTILNYIRTFHQYYVVTSENARNAKLKLLILSNRYVQKRYNFYYETLKISLF